MEAVLNDDEQKYLNSFYEARVIPYDFMILFCANNILNQNLTFNRDYLLDFIVECKNKNEYDTLLREIKIRSNGVFLYSERLENAIFQLKIAGVLYTISPERDASIHIRNDISACDIINQKSEYLDEVAEFVNSYNIYVCDRMAKSIPVMTLAK